MLDRMDALEDKNVAGSAYVGMHAAGSADDAVRRWDGRQEKATLLNRWTLLARHPQLVARPGAGIPVEGGQRGYGRCLS